MTTLQWDDQLHLDLPQLDTIHREFVDLLAQTEQTPDGELLALWQDIITHTEEHFGLEDRWMLAAGFAPENCHMHQHKAVLDVLHEGAKRAQAGDLPLLRSIVPELASWFINHAKTMDAALVYHLQSTGFDIDAPLPAAAATGAQATAPAASACGCSGSSEAKAAKAATE